MSEENKGGSLERLTHYVEMNRDSITEIKKDMDRQEDRISKLSDKVGVVELRSNTNVIEFTNSITNLDKLSTIQDSKINSNLKQIMYLEERMEKVELESETYDSKRQDVIYKIVLQIVGALIGYFIGSNGP